MKKIIIFLFSMGLILNGCSRTGKEESKKLNVCDVDCEVANMEDYKFLKEDHVFQEISFKEVNELLAEKEFTGIIYFGYPGCPWCEEAVPIMNKVAKSDKLEIYYVNKKSETNIATPQEEEKTTATLDEAYGLNIDEETKKPRLYVPEVIVVKEGEIISNHSGTVEDHDSTKREMNEDEKRMLKKIYENMFNDIK